MIQGVIETSDLVYGDTWDGLTFEVSGASIGLLARVQFGMQDGDGKLLLLDSVDDLAQENLAFTLASASPWVILVKPRDLEFAPGTVTFWLKTFTTEGVGKTYVAGSFDILDKDPLVL